MPSGEVSSITRSPTQPWVMFPMVTFRSLMRPGVLTPIVEVTPTELSSGIGRPGCACEGCQVCCGTPGSPVGMVIGTLGVP